MRTSIVRRLYRCGHGVLALLALAALACVLAVLIVGMETQGGTATPLLGNSPENVQRAIQRAGPDAFTFLVVGDVRRGTATFEKLLALASREAPAFVVIAGDFVASPRFADHRLFATEITEDAPPFPIFLVPGNHDVSPHGPFRVEDFEQAYGPAQFHFTIGDRLFVFLNNVPPARAAGSHVRFLQRALSAPPRTVRDIFVFMHIPPLRRPGHPAPGRATTDEPLLELFSKHHVRYVFAGHHHGYWKRESDGTTYIVTGGGGARLHDPSTGFHHLVKVTVEGGRVDETVIATGRALEAFEAIERTIAVRIWPVVVGSGLGVAGMVAVLLGAIWLLAHAAERWREAGRA